MSASLLRAARGVLGTVFLYALSSAAVYGVSVLSSRAGLFAWSHAVWPLWRTHPHLALPHLVAIAAGMVLLPMAWEKAVRRADGRELGLVLPAHGIQDWLLGAGLVVLFVGYGWVLSRELGTPWRLPERLDGMLAIAWLVVACGEEFLYRGVVQRRLGRIAGEWGGLALGAVFFAFAAHPWAPWVHNLVFRVPFGLVLGYLYMRSGSLLVPIGAHWAFNVALRV